MSIRRGVELRASGPSPTLRGWGVFAAAVLALIFAVLLRRQDLLIIGIFLAVLVLAALIAVTLIRPSFTVTRSLSPDTIAAGDSAQVILTLQPGSSGIIGLRRWRDHLAPGLTTLEQHGVEQHGVEQHRTGHGDSLRSVVRGERRGRYWVGPVLLEFTDPFGIARGEQLVGSARSLTVTPPVLDVAADGGGMFGGDGSEQVLQRPASPSADELIAREYRSGDPMRRVHWRATARHGELMVRQEEQRSNPAAWLVVDTRPPVGGSREGVDPDFELLVEVAAAVGAFLIRNGFSITVAETSRNGDSVFERAGGEREFLGALAVLQPHERSAGEPVRPFADALRSGGGAVPLVAVLRAGSPAASPAMAALRPYCDPGIIFLVGSQQDGSAAVGPAEFPGWSCVTVASRSDIGPACRQGLGAGDRVGHG